MATASAKTTLSGLPRRLVADSVVSEADALSAVAAAQRNKQSLVVYLVENKIATSRDVATAASEEFGIPTFDLDSIDMESIPATLVEEKLIEKHHALPLTKRGNKLFVGMSDPTNLAALDEFKFHTGLSTEAVLVEESKLGPKIEQVLNIASGAEMSGMLDEDLDNLEITDGEESKGDDVGASDVDDTPVVRFVNKVLLDAINKGASDIHIEPYEKVCRVRYRIDGVLQEVASPPLNMAARITARVKVMSRMDISERRVPQDGRIKMKLSKKRAIDFRVNTCPTLFGEKIVLRILDPTSAQLGIDSLGYEEDQKQLYLKALANPYGMILVTGPTGSGKTVSLYTGLNILNTPDRNISTAEDPAEINLAGINQVNVNPKVGLTFAEALRSFLRQDPDIIMVGEIRDLETAEIAIKAAQTGHLVLSTLHTNDAASSVTRLLEMGVEDYLLTSTLNGVIGQRLVRVLCPHCKERYQPLPELVRELNLTPPDSGQPIQLHRPVGCAHCAGTGYHGRLAIQELLTMNDDIRKLVLSHADAGKIQEAAIRNGMITMYRDGLHKALSGVTNIEEVIRVTQEA